MRAHLAWRTGRWRPPEVRNALRAGKRTRPSNPQAIEALAVAAAADGRLDDAIALNRLIFHWYPARMGAALRLLRGLDAAGAPDLVAIAEEVHRRFPNRTEPLAILAREAARRGDSVAAERVLAGHPELRKRLGAELAGIAFENAHAHGDATAELEAARALFGLAPHALKPQLRLLRLLDENGEGDELVRVAATVARRFPDRTEPGQALARAAERCGADVEAARLWRDLARARPDREYFARREAAAIVRAAKSAEAAGKSGTVAEGVRQLTSALDVLGPHERLCQTLARLEHRRGRYVAAAAAWRDWMALAPSERPALWLQAGRTFAAAGMPGAAGQALDTAAAAGVPREQVEADRAGLLETLHRWEEAEAIRDRLAAATPDDDLALARLVACRAERDVEAAEAMLDRVPERERAAFPLLRARIRLAQRRLDFDAALVLWRRATELFPDEPRAWSGLAQAHAARFETEAALAACVARPGLRETEAIGVARAEAFLQSRRLVEADTAIAALETPAGTNLRAAQLRARRLQIDDNLDGAAAALSEALAQQPGAIKAVHDLAVLYIRAGRSAEACEVIAGIASDYDSRTDVAELRSWEAAQRGAMEEARALWTPAIARGFPALRPLGDPLRPDRPVPPPARLQLFAFLRNERNRLPYFLKHYRQLGVERFHLVDNGSDDGSAEYLARQDDVCVFRTTQSYRDAVSGMRWINHLVAHYGGTGWSLHADVDEFLILPGIEGRTLQDYLLYLERHGFEAVRAFLLDLYPARAADAQGYRAGENPRLRCPFFDDNYRVYGGHRAPYAMVEGGMRERLFHQYGLHQCKTPLIRAGRDIRFLASSHFTSPARVADLTGAMLHYKFLGQFKARIAEEAGRRQYSNAAKNIVHLHNRISGAADSAPWTGPDSRVFASSRQLVEMGLLDPGAFNVNALDLPLGEADDRAVLEAS